MNLFSRHFFSLVGFSCLFVPFCAFLLFSSCYGAIGQRGHLINSGVGNRTPLPVAPPPSAKRTDEEKQKELQQTTEQEKAPEKDDPKEFNYFPYDLQVDSISYLSCTTNNYWHFQAGAYFSRSGLRLSEYFLKRLSSKSASEMESLIKSSTKHKATPHLAMGYKNHLLNVLQPKVAFNGGMALDRLIPDLIRSDKARIREYNGDPISANIIQSLYVTNDKFRDGLESKLVLMLYYKGGKNNNLLHTTGGVVGRDIYGRIYTLGLTDLDMVPDDSADRYALTSVSEEKRPQAPDQKDWSCPDSLRLQIRRHSSNAYKISEWYAGQNADFKNKYKSASATLNAENPDHRPLPDEPTCSDSSSGGAKLEVARAVLGSKWNINIGDKCISPKNSKIPCYWISEQKSVSDRLELRSGAKCSVKYDAKGYQTHCPQFLSICVRNN